MTYGQSRLLLWQLRLMFPVAAVIGVLLWVSAVAGGSPPIAAAAAWTLAFAWNAYWFLLRFAQRLDVDDRALRWTAPARTGSIPLARLTSAGPFLVQLYVIRAAGHPSVLVIPQRGLPAFLTDLQALAPQMTVRVGRFARLADRLPGRRAYRRSS